jgi:aspartate aminotransferase
VLIYVIIKLVDILFQTLIGGKEMKFSGRITNMQQSPIRKLVPIAEAAKKRGKTVYHLNIGQPDVKTPEVFFDALKNFDKEVLAYSFSQGSPELLESFSSYYKSYGIDFDPADILVTNGGSEALVFAMLAICDNGDEVLVPEPFYTNYNGFGNVTGISVVPITTKAENGFNLPSKEEIKKLVTPKTKGILLSNPGNPTGAVYSKEQLNIVRELAKENNLYIIADEVYREYIFDDFPYMSFAQFDDISDRVIIIDSISKRYSACGARIGSLASKNKDLIAQVLKLCQGRLCVPTIEQLGAAALAKVPKEYFDKTKEEYRQRRDIVYNALQEMPGVVCELPHGAFYIMAKLPVKNAEKFVIWMLEEFDVEGETVMFAPAEGFYGTPGLGVDEIRMAYVLNQESLKKAMNILKMGLEAYPDKK